MRDVLVMLRFKWIASIRASQPYALQAGQRLADCTHSRSSNDVRIVLAWIKLITTSQIAQSKCAFALIRYKP